jgi:hypothetical protein
LTRQIAEWLWVRVARCDEQKQIVFGTLDWSAPQKRDTRLRLGMENGKVKSNPAKLLKHKTEDNERVRFLNQFTPAKTKLEYLLPHTDEESRLRAVILKHYADHMPEFEIALHTGMRPSE